MIQPKIRRNNYYILIKDGEKWWDFSSENLEYFLYETGVQHFLEVPPQERSHYKIRDFDIYIIIEPASDGQERVMNQVKLLRNLPKHFKTIKKWELEPIIRELKLKKSEK